MRPPSRQSVLSRIESGAQDDLLLSTAERIAGALGESLVYVLTAPDGFRVMWFEPTPGQLKMAWGYPPQGWLYPMPSWDVEPCRAEPPGPEVGDCLQVLAAHRARRPGPAFTVAPCTAAPDDSSELTQSIGVYAQHPLRRAAQAVLATA